MKKQKGETLRKIIAAVVSIAVIAVLAFLVTWQPADDVDPYVAYTVDTKTLERTLEDTGNVTKRVQDEEEQTVVQIFVDEFDVVKLAEDDEVTLTVGALEEDGEELKGTIDTIADEPRITGDVTEYEVVVEFDEVPEEAKVGMHVDMVVVLDTREEVLAVPNASLYQDGDLYYVDSLTESRRVYLERLGVDRTIQETAPVEVEIDFEGDEYTEITDGLEEGDVIVAE